MIFDKYNPKGFHIGAGFFCISWMILLFLKDFSIYICMLIGLCGVFFFHLSTNERKEFNKYSNRY